MYVSLTCGIKRGRVLESKLDLGNSEDPRLPLCRCSSQGASRLFLATECVLLLPQQFVVPDDDVLLRHFRYDFESLSFRSASRGQTHLECKKKKRDRDREKELEI